MAMREVARGGELREETNAVVSAVPLHLTVDLGQVAPFTVR
jgi:hypothetical protein